MGVSRVHESSVQAAGGFAILSPMPAVMWSPDTLFKLSLRRISLPSPEALTAALHKEQAKLPRRLEVLRKDPGKAVQLDAGRKLGELTLEVLTFPSMILLPHITHTGCMAWDMCSNIKVGAGDE